jgi:hypothetical protein
VFYIFFSDYYYFFLQFCPFRFYCIFFYNPFFVIIVLITIFLFFSWFIFFLNFVPKYLISFDFISSFGPHSFNYFFHNHFLSFFAI